MHPHTHARRKTARAAMRSAELFCGEQTVISAISDGQVDGWSANGVIPTVWPPCSFGAAAERQRAAPDPNCAAGSYHDSDGIPRPEANLRARQK